MPVTLGWGDVAVRLALTVLAGTLIGFNRGEHGRPAGLRTTLLVCLAASVSMIQANLLMGSTGKAHDSFVVLDLMRLPLGILSGMGFIGAGAILRRDNMVVGVTTAATLWFITVIGLCLGGGQLLLGMAALALGLATLSGLKQIEVRIPQDRKATLVVTAGQDSLTEADLREILRSSGYRVVSSEVALLSAGRNWRLRCEVRWRAARAQSPTPPFVADLARRPGVLTLAWRPSGVI